MRSVAEFLYYILFFECLLQLDFLVIFQKLWNNTPNNSCPEKTCCWSPRGNIIFWNKHNVDNKTVDFFLIFMIPIAMRETFGTPFRLLKSWTWDDTLDLERIYTCLYMNPRHIPSPSGNEQLQCQIQNYHVSDAVRRKCTFVDTILGVEIRGNILNNCISMGCIWLTDLPKYLISIFLN